MNKTIKLLTVTFFALGGLLIYELMAGSRATVPHELAVIAPGEAPHNAALFVAPPAILNSRAVDLSKHHIELSDRNTYMFRGPVTMLSASKAQSDIIKKARNLSKGERLYLILDTPGGDIMAGNQLIDTISGLPNRTDTITLFAASMGFNIAQRLGTRYVLPSGTLMAHRARVEGVGGQVPGEFITAAATLYGEVTSMEKQNAKRLNISFADYTTLVKDEYWVTGENAVKQGAADAVALITCDESLDGTHTESVQVFIFNVNVTYSNCPAVTGPLGFEVQGAVTNEQLTAIRKVLVNGSHSDHVNY